MKPLKSETEDADALQELGRASVQIIHDLKNQINGLKLYATFLRKRLEKAERPADELETLAKLIAGLERAAADTSALVRYGRPMVLRRAPRTDLAKLLKAAVEGGPAAAVEMQEGSYDGEFDPVALSEALKSINASVMPSDARVGAAAPSNETSTDIAARGSLEVRLRRDPHGAQASPVAVIEWSGIRANGDADMFHSFAGQHGLRMALAGKVIEAHGGEASQEADTIRVRLPLTS